MWTWFAATAEILILIPLAVVASWLARTALRVATRRAVRRANGDSGGSWRVRLDRRNDGGQSAVRRRQRADAVARMLGNVVTVVIVVITALVGLNLAGVDAVFAISSAGFIGFALAISAQDFVKDFLAGIRVLLEDRYAVGDVVVVSVGGNEVHGTVDLIGAASLRVRTNSGATWHAGHHVVESVVNQSQLPAVTNIDIPLAAWAASDRAGAPDRLAEASNDIGLTGVVFVRDVDTAEANGSLVDTGRSDADDVNAHDVNAYDVNATMVMTAVPQIAGADDPVDLGSLAADPLDGTDGSTVTVSVKANRPLTTAQADLIRDRLLDRPH